MIRHNGVLWIGHWLAPFPCFPFTDVQDIFISRTFDKKILRKSTVFLRFEYLFRQFIFSSSEYASQKTTESYHFIINNNMYIVFSLPKKILVFFLFFIRCILCIVITILHDSYFFVVPGKFFNNFSLWLKFVHEVKKLLQVTVKNVKISAKSCNMY